MDTTNTSDHHHRRAGSFRWRLVRPGTLVLGRSKSVKEVAGIIGIAEATVKDAHVLRAEEAGRVGRDRVVGVSPSSHLRRNSRRMYGNGMGASPTQQVVR